LCFNQTKPVSESNLRTQLEVVGAQLEVVLAQLPPVAWLTTAAPVAGAAGASGAAADMPTAGAASSAIERVGASGSVDVV
jgi:hypothetical protein